MSASGVSETMRHRVAVGDLLASWAARRPDRLCLAMDDREYTFAEMDEMADQVNAGMAGSHRQNTAFHGIGARLAARLAADSVIETEMTSEIPREADQLDYGDEDQRGQGRQQSDAPPPGADRGKGKDQK
jgi:non-ribosomal peptide synthetase component F